MALPETVLLLLLAATACGEPAPPARPQSQPVASPTDPVSVGGGPVPQPVPLHRLVPRHPALVDLPTLPALVVEGVLNTEPAPCAPCQAQDKSVAACAEAIVPGCENLPELVARAARVARAGGSPTAVRAVISYGDPWMPEPGAGSPGWPDPAAPVQVELWLDPSWGPWREAVAHAEALVTLGRAEPTVGPLAVQVRLLPGWTLRGEEGPPPGARALHEAVAAADQLGLGLPYALALARAGSPLDPAAQDAAAAEAGLDHDAWQGARQAAAARLDLDAAAATRLELRSAPSWRVDGYRLRGHRSLANLRDVVENQQLDHLATLPAALLAPWDPGLGSAGAGQGTAPPPGTAPGSAP